MIGFELSDFPLVSFMTTYFGLKNIFHEGPIFIAFTIVTVMELPPLWKTLQVVGGFDRIFMSLTGIKLIEID